VPEVEVLTEGELLEASKAEVVRLANDLVRARSELAQVTKALTKMRAEMERERRLKDIARRQREIASDEAMRLKVDLDITAEALKIVQDRLGAAEAVTHD
jgi:plasmid maintenance system antidote protein VapI